MAHLQQSLCLPINRRRKHTVYESHGFVAQLPIKIVFLTTDFGLYRLPDGPSSTRDGPSLGRRDSSDENVRAQGAAVRDGSC